MSAYVYRVRDAVGRLLYVGCSVDVDARLKQHAEHSDWWPFRSSVERVSYPTQAEALEAETEAILSEHPRWNMRGRSPDHPDGAATSMRQATWLHYERDVARRIRKLTTETARLKREFSKASVSLRGAMFEAAAVGSGLLDTEAEELTEAVA